MEIELHNLINPFERDGFTINVMKETYKKRKNTRKFLKKKKNLDHSILYENKQILESTKEVAAKYERILNVNKLIKRKERKALKDITSQTNASQTNESQTNANRIRVQREALKDITSQTNTNRLQVQQDMTLQYNVERREGNDNITHHSSQHLSHTTANYNNNNNQI